MFNKRVDYLEEMGIVLDKSTAELEVVKKLSPIVNGMLANLRYIDPEEFIRTWNIYTLAIENTEYYNQQAKSYLVLYDSEQESK